MFLGFIGKLLYEGRINELREEIVKLPLNYEDIRIISAILNAIASGDPLSIFIKMTHEEHEVDRDERLREIVERLDEARKLAEAIGGKNDKIIAKRYEQLIELLGAPIGYGRGEE